MVSHSLVLLGYIVGVQSSSGDCTCSGFVHEENGYGMCKRNYKGRPICYVNEPSSCSDVQTHDSLGPTGYSWEACKQASPCEGDSGDVSSKAAMEANGWVFDFEYPDRQNLAACKTSPQTWYGWSGRNAAGVLSRTLEGSGKYTLDFGNCWNGGNVNVYLNNVKIGSAPPSTMSKVITFDYVDGDILQIKDEDGNSVVKLNGVSCAPAGTPGQQYTIRRGQHCGDANIVKWNDGTSANYGKTKGLTKCMEECIRRDECKAFVFRTRDKKCFWKSAVKLNKRSGHHCYEKKAAATTTTTTTTPSEGECKDNWLCGIWQRLGFCDKPAIAKRCPKSCNAC
jgi:hypothetical protein